ncbi:MAG: insulinase family protein, partial [Sinomicrobium sp.]|nr:insulinase family protein [Sinomicrobium sp.]
IQNLVDLKMTDKDYFPALLANKILGGGGEARLFLNLREDKGYTYGAYSSISTDKYAPSRFRASASVRNSVTDSAVVAFLDEINRIGTEKVSDEELTNAKAKYTGDFVLALERPETIARYALNIETENLPDNFYQTYLEKINTVTSEQVRKAAEKYFKTKNLRIVVTGKGSEVVENLEKVSFNGKKIPVRYFDKYGEKAEKPSYNKPSGLPEGITATTVLNNYIDAIGGTKKIDNISSLIIRYEADAMGATIMSEEKRMAGKVASTIYRNDTPMMATVATETEAFRKQGDSKIAFPDGMIKEMGNFVGIFPELKMLAGNEAKLTGI